jgi:hypothetical protein
MGCFYEARFFFFSTGALHGALVGDGGDFSAIVIMIMNHTPGQGTVFS